MCRGREKSLVPVGIQTPCLPARNLVKKVPTTTAHYLETLVSKTPKLSPANNMQLKFDKNLANYKKTPTWYTVRHHNVVVEFLSRASKWPRSTRIR